MSHVQQCLSVFAVAAWANTPESLAQAKTAIEHYLANFGPERELEALEALCFSYREMSLDSAVADAIRKDIDEMIARLISKEADGSEGSSATI